MKVLVQRVTEARVRVNGVTVGDIGKGFLLFVALGKEDDESKLTPMAKKVAHLRVFPDENGRFHHSLLDVEGAALVVSQFTLYADTAKGRRPEFFGAMEPERAKDFCQQFEAELKAIGIQQVESGEFGAMMDVELTNDGPVTIMLES